MIRTLIRVILPTIFLGIFFAGHANAAAMQIECPFTHLETGVRTPLPQGWFSTPARGPSTSVQVTTSANGQKLLTCGYQTRTDFEYIRMEAPSGSDCMAEESGFVCVSAGVVAPGRATFLTGDTSVPQTYTMDLDTGSLGGGGADIWFRAENSIVRYLEPINGATMAIAGFNPINFDGCNAIGGYSFDTIEMHNLPAGIYICVSTSEGRIAQFRVNTPVTNFNDVLGVGFITWSH